MPERSAIVTGSSRGIGRAIADVLAQHGYSLTITGRRPEGVEQAVGELRDAGADVQGVALNHADPDAPAEIIKRHNERFGRLDVLVNNAGVGIGANADEQQTKFVDMQLGVNVRAVILFYREAIPLLKASAKETGQSHVINLASISGKSGQPWLSVYSATKAAVVGYTEAMSKELASAHIKSTALCPGFVDTDMTEFVREQLPAEEMIRPQDIAEGVRFVLKMSRGCTIPEIVFMRPGDTAGLV
jgi:NAD(P)-dependent dehydrogenase (short-subunit alcohol dehydrogenase family)